MKRIVFTVVCTVYITLAFADKEVNATSGNDVSDALEEYFRTLSQESALDFTIILSSNRYYDDGSLEQSDTLAFTSKADDDTLLKNFNLTNIGKKNIKKLAKDAKNKGVLLSLYQEVQVDGVKTEEDFDTKETVSSTAAAANVVLHPDGFVVGLEEEIRDAMDLTENVATIQVLEYFEEGAVKKNTTTSVYSNKVNVINSHKMPPRMVQTSAELLRKAYKIDMDDRTPFVSQLFEKEFPRYEWKVIANSTGHIPKKGISVTLATGQDKYDIIGVLKSNRVASKSPE